MKKILPVVAIVLLFFFFSLSAFVTLTTPGLALLITLAKWSVPGELSVATIKGSLINGVVLHEVRYNDDRHEFLIAEASIALRLSAVVQKELVVTSLKLRNVAFKELQQPPTSNKIELPQITLPFSLHLEQAMAESVDINQFSSSKGLHVSKLSLTHLSMVKSHLQVKSLHLLHERFSVELQGELRTTGDYPLHISSAYHITPAQYSPISGNSTIEGHLLDCLVTSNIGKPVQASFSTRLIMDEPHPRWNIEATSKAVDLSAVNIQWPNIVLGDLQLKGSGTFDKAALMLQTTGNLADYPNLGDIATQATIELHADGLRITELAMKKGTSRIHANGHLDWNKKLSWSVAAQAKELDPSIWFAGWQGTLNGNGSLQGHLTSKGIYADFEVTEGHGQLRGYQVNGQGRATLQGNMLHIESLKITSGESQLTAHGEWGSDADLTVSLQSPDAAQLWPEVAGSVTAIGTVQGTRDNPDIALHLSGNEIAYKTHAINRLEASVQGKLSTDEKLVLRLSALDVDAFDQHADDIQLTVTGNPENVELRAKLKQGEQVSSISLQGKQKDRKWHGKVDSVTIDTKRIGSWEMKQPSLFSASTKEITLEEICLTSAFPEEICVAGAYTFNSQWTVNGNIQSLSTKTLQNIFAQKNVVQGFIQGSLRLAGHSSTIDKGELHIATADAAMVSPVTSAIDSLQHIQGKLNATYIDAELKAETKIRLGDGSYLDGTVAVTVPEPRKFPAPVDLALLPITGQMTLQVKDVSTMNVFWEEYTKMTGRLQGTLNIAGNLKQPLLTGTIQLTQGTADLLALGVTLDPLSLKAEINTTQLILSANAQSGTGDLSANGSVYLDKGVSQDLHFLINGTHFEVANNDEMQVFISPDLVVTRRNGLVHIKGTITFPEAHIAYTGQEGSITPSSDVVIVDAEQNAATSDPAFPLRTSITLIAGDAVDIDAYGLKGVLKGQLHVTDISGELPLATGSLLINNGTFILYGKRLDIDVGRLLFSGGPLDNPGIEVRTEKRDNGTSVGMEIGGFLQHPEIRFYSSAAMEQYEILSRLLASSSSSGEVQGQTGVLGDLAKKAGFPQVGEILQSSKELLSIDDIRLDTGDFFDDVSLIIGSWLTPRFYVSYGHSLLKDSASFNTSYTLGKGFFFQTETSTTQNGGDIIYEIKK